MQSVSVILKRSPNSHFCQIIIISDHWFQSRCLKFLTLVHKENLLYYVINFIRLCISFIKSCYNSIVSCDNLIIVCNEFIILCDNFIILCDNLKI